MRYSKKGRALARRFQDAGLINDLERTWLIARWAYEQGQAGRARLWIRDKEYEPCDYRWQAAMGVPRDLQLAADDPPTPDE